MTLLRFAHATVASEVLLPELPAATEGSSDGPCFTVRLAGPSSGWPEQGEWVHRWESPARDPVLVLGKAAGWFLLRFDGLADFLISTDTSTIEVDTRPGTNQETLRHLLLDQVLPRLLAHLGLLVLHAGAVRAGDAAIAFLGASGAGKSTLAGSLALAGWPLLSDDGLVVLPDDDQVRALPTYPSLRLWPESVAGLFDVPPPQAPMAHYSTKRRVMLSDPPFPVDRPTRLGAVFVLEPREGGDGPEVSSLPPSDACMALVRNAFQLDLTDERRAGALLSLAASCAGRVPVRVLSFPWGLEHLPAVRSCVLNWLGHLGPDHRR